MRLVGTLLLALACTSVGAKDFFDDGKPQPWAKGDLVAGSTTLGGYPIPQHIADEWRVYDVKSSQSGARGNAESINRGFVTLVQMNTNGVAVGAMNVAVNLATTGLNQYMTGTPCAGTHLLVANRGAGLDDNCLVVDVETFDPSTTEATFFTMRVTQSRSSGRLYGIELRLSANELGFPGTNPSDWQLDIVQKSQEKAAFLERLKIWTKALQDATEKAVQFSKPANAFEGVPSYQSLLEGR